MTGRPCLGGLSPSFKGPEVAQRVLLIWRTLSIPSFYYGAERNTHLTIKTKTSLSYCSSCWWGLRCYVYSAHLTTTEGTSVPR